MASQQATVTLTGFVGTDPVLRGGESGTGGVTTFRLGTTRSYYHREQGAWVDRPTTWITVKAFRRLAQNVASSVRKRDAVIVTGTLGTDRWTTNQNEERSALVIEATAVGHDLNHGISSYRRDPKVGEAPPAPVAPAVMPQQAAGTVPAVAPGAMPGMAPMPEGTVMAGASAGAPPTEAPGTQAAAPPAEGVAPAAGGEFSDGGDGEAF